MHNRHVQYSALCVCILTRNQASPWSLRYQNQNDYPALLLPPEEREMVSEREGGRKGGGREGGREGGRGGGGEGGREGWKERLTQQTTLPLTLGRDISSSAISSFTTLRERDRGKHLTSCHTTHTYTHILYIHTTHTDKGLYIAALGIIQRSHPAFEVL